MIYNERGVICYELHNYEEAENSFVSVLQLIDSYPPVDTIELY